MKAMKTLLVTGATLAFMAPAAHATFDSVAAPRTKAKTVKVVKAQKTHKSSHHAIVAANNGSDQTDASSSGPNYGATDGPLYIIWSSPLGSQIPVQSGDCESTGNDCTPAELCSYWGENCDQVDASQSADDQSMQNQNPAG